MATATFTDKKELRAQLAQPSVRISSNWTPARIRSTLSAADGGRLSQAAELCDLLMADDRVQQSLEDVIGGMLGLDVDFEPSKGPSAEQAVEALDEDWYFAFPEVELFQLIAWGVMLGVSFAQLVWRQENGRVVPGLKFYHPKHARWDWQTRSWWIQVDGNAEVEIQPGDGKWIVFTPYGDYRPWAKGKWRGLAEWWLVKEYAKWDWARSGENTATKVVTSDPEQGAGFDTKEQRADIAAKIDELGSQGTVALPPGYDLKTLQLAAATYTVFKAQIEMANMAIDISIKAQNLTTQVDGGSRAAAEVHERVQDAVIRFLARRVETCLREQGLEWWAEFNFGSAESAPWARFHTDEDEDVNQRAERLDKLADALVKLQDAGLTLSAEEIEEGFGFKFTAVSRPNQQGQNNGTGGDDPEPGDDGSNPAADPEARAHGALGARAGVSVRDMRAAASGRSDDGPDYVDGLTQSSKASAATELAPFVGAILAIIDEESENAGEDDPITVLRRARARVRDEYADQPPELLVELTASVGVLSRLAGMYAVRTEDGGLSPDEG